MWNGFEVSKCVCVNERNVCLLLTDLCECVCLSVFVCFLCCLLNYCNINYVVLAISCYIICYCIWLYY